MGNYESISVEASGEHDNINVARLIATRKALEIAYIEMARIFNVRVQNINSSPFDQVQYELAVIKSELGT